MRILLVQAGTGAEKRDESVEKASFQTIINPPLGLCYIGTYLKKENHTVKGIDLYVVDTFKELIDELNKSPGVVGISFTTEYYENARRVVDACREYSPNSFIVCGGYHASFKAKETIEDLGIDAVIPFDAEYVMLDLVKAIENGLDVNDVAGVVTKTNKYLMGRYPKDINNLLIPDREIFNFDKYLAILKTYGNRFFTITGTRGCPHNCIFCVAAQVRKHRPVRLRSVESIIAEIEFMYNKYKLKKFLITDELFIQDKKRVVKFCSKLKDVGQFRWRCEARANRLSGDLIQELAAAGCTGIQIGIESGSDEVLKDIKKGITVEQIIKAAEWAAAYGVTMYGILIFGLPTDTSETLKKTSELYRRLTEMGIWVFHSFLTPFPGTEIGDDLEKYEIKVHSNRWADYNFGNCNVSTKNLSKENIVKTVDDLHKNAARV